jgi:hypothetical protein
VTARLRLHPDDLQAIVDGVRAAVVPTATSGAPRWLSTAEVALAFGRSQEWVRDHAAELGGRKIGGPRAPWRFPAECLDRREQASVPPEPPPQSQPLRRRSSGVELLPIRG